MKVLEKRSLNELFDVLRGKGHTLIGPTVRGGAVVYEELESIDDLPAGRTDEQAGGTYRLGSRGDDAVFGFAVGPHSWKQYLFPPRQQLFRAERGDGSVRIFPGKRDEARCAFIGVRPCDLSAIAIQDRVFREGAHVDPAYRERREKAFLVAVHCGSPSGTCFCASMATGPMARSGFDLALTEILNAERHFFVVESGSQSGEDVLTELDLDEATEEDELARRQVLERAAARMGRTLETEGLAELLGRSSEHPHWDQVAERCLACGNCTLVCPTCFCSTVEDTRDLKGEAAERRRLWDSCFTADFSHLHGGSVRASVRSRYRQWMTHKLSTWIDQFGTSGCVGCGRCITWCPVGIDITEEARALRGGRAREDHEVEAS